MKIKRKKLLIFVLVVLILALCPYPIIGHNTETYVQAYKLVKMRTLIGKTYDECHGILQDHGIYMGTENIKYNQLVKFKGKTEKVYAVIICNAGESNYVPYILTVCFDDNMNVKFVYLSEDKRGR
ncbi:MAG: hypothetical protein K2N72_11885 [Oscillospiraceae bacterium]|nr:hypothetical protein [Oscillospiraceae bacterium]